MCDCGWTQQAAACDGIGDGSECWRTCCSVPAMSDGAAMRSNPFTRTAFYVNPTYRQHIRSTKEHSDDPLIKAALESLIDVPSAYWLDTKERLSGADSSTDTLEGILADAAAQAVPPLCVFIVYDLPNRDCKALASNGQICCTYRADRTCDYEAVGGNCSAGLAEYASEYIDPMRAILERYTQVPVALIVEPDSLPNLVTNQADPRCGNHATIEAYREGVKYAVHALATVPSVSLYLDAAHGGWLGWPVQAGKFAQLVAELGVHSKLRGYSANVANYQPLGSACPSSSFPLHEYCAQDQAESPACCRDMCSLIATTSDGNNELNYVQMLANHLRAAGVTSPHFVIDTGRNGVDDMREDCSNWCNIRGAGLGLWPTADTALPDLVDAYFWLKTPGESDGCTSHLPDGSACGRYDGFCGSADSLGSRVGEPFAPEAGEWFTEQVLQLASHEHTRFQTRAALGLVHPPKPPPYTHSMAPMHAAAMLRSPASPPSPLLSVPSAEFAAPFQLLVPLLLTLMAIAALRLFCTRRGCRRFRGLRLLAMGDGLDSATELTALERAGGPDTPGLSSTAELEAAELAVAQAELRVKKAELQAARGRAAAQEGSDGWSGARDRMAALEQASMDAEILD